MYPHKHMFNNGMYYQNNIDVPNANLEVPTCNINKKFRSCGRSYLFSRKKKSLILSKYFVFKPCYTGRFITIKYYNLDILKVLSTYKHNKKTYLNSDLNNNCKLKDYTTNFYSVKVHKLNNILIPNIIYRYMRVFGKKSKN